MWLAGLAWLAGLGRVGVVWPHDCKQLLHPSGCGGLLVACLLGVDSATWFKKDKPRNGPG